MKNKKIEIENITELLLQLVNEVKYELMIERYCNLETKFKSIEYWNKRALKDIKKIESRKNND